MTKNKFACTYIDGVYTLKTNTHTITSRTEGYIKSYLAGWLDCSGVSFKQDSTLGQMIDLVNLQA